MLTIADISKSYGTRELFAEVSLFIARTDRYGLVGPNGAGKVRPSSTSSSARSRPTRAPSSAGARRGLRLPARRRAPRPARTTIIR